MRLDLHVPYEFAPLTGPISMLIPGSAAELRLRFPTMLLVSKSMDNIHLLQRVI